ncbi:MAG: YaiO family outer membrane beta-barrel protein [Gammaproteobacteria bacterium]|nr:YaiO family outer membrane beta-barrel protein [Gammaproteobacteria bacterium]
MPTRSGVRQTLATVLIIVGLLPQWVVADEQELRLFHRYSTLSNGLSDWQDWQLHWERKGNEKHWDYLSLENQSRYGIQDNNFRFGHHYNQSEKQELRGEVSLSQNNDLFPAYSLLGGLSRKLNAQTILDLGLRLSHFYKVHPITSMVTEPNSVSLSSRLDYYFGNSLLAYSLIYTQMQSPGLNDAAVSQSIKYLYVYDGRSNLFISLGSGDEVDFEPSNTSLVISRIDNISAGGSHWLSARTALVYTVGLHQIGSSGFSYQRNELYLGIRRLL